MDEADKIQSVLFLLEKFRLFPLEKLMPLLDRVRIHFTKDEHIDAAASEYAHLDSRIRYVVYGHTHDPLQAALRVSYDSVEPNEYVYLNSGTWRTRYYKSKKGLSFIGWKNLSYVVFYKKEERELNTPTFETWTGTLKKI
jgi:hypothetical protein